jgi:predicted dehydrogenase
MKKSNSATRREFLKTSSTAAIGVGILGPTIPHSVLGSNDKIRMGFIGVGNRGTQLLHNFMRNRDIEVAALCDVYEPYITRNPSSLLKRYIDTGRVPKLGESFPKEYKQYKDFRKLLEQKDIDAVCIATPDHWHAIQMIQAVEAGKDVYVEKPLTKTIHEGRRMVEAQKRTNRVVQVGLNRRGSSIYQSLAKEIPNGKIGKVITAQAYRISDMYPNGIGKLKPEAPPKDLDWDMWVGPRQFRDYQYNIAPYFFRWWSDYSSQMGNWGVHYMDAIRWMTGETAPSAINAQGGKYILDDDRDIPDTMEVTFEFESGMMVRFSIYEGTHGVGVKGGEIEMRGSKGTIVVDQNGYKIIPAKPGQFQTWDKLIEPEEESMEGKKKFGDLAISENSTAILIRNFLDCVKSRETPWCTLEDGHRSTSFAHLANISLAVGQRIEWDAKEEKITNNKMANNLLHYEYRKPWQLG